MAVTPYRGRKPGDPDIEVSSPCGPKGHWFDAAVATTASGKRRCAAFSYDDNGRRVTRKDWIPVEDLTVVSVDDRPADAITPFESPPD